MIITIVKFLLLYSDCAADSASVNSGHNGRICIGPRADLCSCFGKLAPLGAKQGDKADNLRPL